MTVVMSEISVFVSRPMSSSLDSPPKMEVRRRMKVDLPQPESAATPMITGVDCFISTADTRDCDRRDCDSIVGGAKATAFPASTESMIVCRQRWAGGSGGQPVRAEGSAHSAGPG